ncbi:polyketide synthase dehydratase domain-containing protein, partial [Streptomyces sp. NPDC058221]|uniref:polyketide synthase dehydratase domain-containing protein n=1 Tax=Streptomyces sp. NPDC058221 TaxID=3346388 RepID=UPI0036EF8153
FYSTLTGGLLPADRALDADYWYDNLRHTVRFEEATRSLISADHHLFIEVSPHPGLVVGIQETIEDAGSFGAALGTLRRDDGGRRRLLTALAGAHAAGAPVDWSPLLGAPAERHVDLPTYAFQRERYWLESAQGPGDTAGLGLEAANHSLLGAAVALADGDGAILTGRISLQSHPWLADHAVGETVLMPGTGFVEMAIRAGDHVGCGRIEELTLRSPLVVPQSGTMSIQISVGAPDSSGHRTFSVHARRDRHDSAPAAETDWTCHATGSLAAGTPSPGTPAATPTATAWPPAGAVSLPVEGRYTELAELGYHYGPVFQGLTAAWRLGETVYAEVSLPEGADNTRLGLHPALLDAALHAIPLSGIAQTVSEPGHVLLPFSWSGVSLHATGARTLRVRMDRTGGDAVALQLTAPTGEPVASVDALSLRSVPAEQFDVPDQQQNSLFRINWVEAPASATTAGAQENSEFELYHSEGHTVMEVLDHVRGWLLGEGSGGVGRLVVVTRGAVAAGGDGDVVDVVGAGVW